MTQRRTPSGQGPARRAGQTRAGNRATGRTTTREPGARTELRTGRTPARNNTGRVAPVARSGSRPAAARRAATGGAAKRTAAPQPRRFTGRATVLLAVLAVLALGYTYPIRVYLAQESQIAETKAAIAAQQAEIADKSELVAKWQDDEYVIKEARERFYYVRPGEVPLVVIHDEAGAARDAGTPQAPPQPAPWYGTLWSSIAAADKEAQ
jgi:cell division protein FtsB